VDEGVPVVLDDVLVLLPADPGHRAPVPWVLVLVEWRAQAPVAPERSRPALHGSAAGRG